MVEGFVDVNNVYPPLHEASQAQTLECVPEVITTRNKQTNFLPRNFNKFKFTEFKCYLAGNVVVVLVL